MTCDIKIEGCFLTIISDCFEYFRICVFNYADNFVIIMDIMYFNYGFSSSFLYDLVILFFITFIFLLKNKDSSYSMS